MGTKWHFFKRWQSTSYTVKRRSPVSRCRCGRHRRTVVFAAGATAAGWFWGLNRHRFVWKWGDPKTGNLQWGKWWSISLGTDKFSDTIGKTSCKKGQGIALSFFGGATVFALDQCPWILESYTLVANRSACQTDLRFTDFALYTLWFCWNVITCNGHLVVWFSPPRRQFVGVPLHLALDPHPPYQHKSSGLPVVPHKAVAEVSKIGNL